MACSTSTFTTGRTCWTTSFDGTNFVPFHVIKTNEWDSVRSSFYIESQTTDYTNGDKLSAAIGVEYSNDGIVWDTAVAIGPTGVSTANAWQYAATYSAISDAKRFARFGVNATHAAFVALGDVVLAANVTIRLELRGV